MGREMKRNNWKKIAYKLANRLYKNEIVECEMERMNADSEGITISRYRVEWVESLIEEIKEECNSTKK